MSGDLILPTVFFRRLNTAIREAGGATGFARKHGLDVRRVYDTQDATVVDEGVAAALGLREVLRYPVTADPTVLAPLTAVYEKLNTFIRECGSQRAAAPHFGIGDKHLSNIVNARRGVTPVLARLGFRAPVSRFVSLTDKKAGSRVS
ncbi:hypothetical protein GOB93_03210 [Acetobacter musti]|uniref:Transcriptional regulator n=1 Tax=Acetobacter musti TaxID=864732 RepID=A0ABX0JJA9_9PROT|nr:hypothetical protein [Acetobacter musti]NHN83648.1 hypothetical protein [Acetobacter musti]